MDFIKRIAKSVLNRSAPASHPSAAEEISNDQTHQPDLVTSPLNGLSARDKVALFADQFLDAEAQRCLKNPVSAEYEHLQNIDVKAMGATAEQSANETARLEYLSSNLDKLSEADWGEFLIEEMLDHSKKAIWIDWKYNVLTMVQEGDWDNVLGNLFEMYGVGPLTPEERAPILDRAEREHGDTPQVLMMEAQQPLAEERGYRLMFFENQSDGMALFMLPVDQADQWHMVQLGYVLIIRADAGIVADPRQGGRRARLTN